MFIGYKLDYEKAFADSNLLNIRGSSEAYYSINDKNTVESEDMYNYTNIYKQSIRYKFRIKPVEVYDLDIYRETTYRSTLYGLPNPNSTKVTNYRVVVLDTGGAFILTRVKPDFKIIPNHEYK